MDNETTALIEYARWLKQMEQQCTQWLESNLTHADSLSHLRVRRIQLQNERDTILGELFRSHGTAVAEQVMAPKSTKHELTLTELRAENEQLRDLLLEVGWQSNT